MALITLLTDFGVSSPYVAQMKGVLASRCPNARIIDLTHSIPPQNVTAGAIVLADSVPWFPRGTVAIAVVDPGVGTERRILAAQIGQWHVVLPDNGLISDLTSHHDVRSVVALDRSEFWLSPVSSTFHGRDIMSPVAAAITQGVPIEELGEPVDNWVQLRIPVPELSGRRLSGEVIFVDSFGNLITNISVEQVSESDRISIEDYVVPGLVQAYGEHRAGELIALVGSSGRLEFAVVDGNAQEKLGLTAGARVRVEHAA